MQVVGKSDHFSFPKKKLNSTSKMENGVKDTKQEINGMLMIFQSYPSHSTQILLLVGGV